MFKLSAIRDEQFKMSVTQGRTAKRLYTLGELVNMFPLVHGEFVPGYRDIITGLHPLPAIFTKQSMDGHVSLLGTITTNLVYTAKMLIEEYHQDKNLPMARRVSGFNMDAIEVYPGPNQWDVIQAYQNLHLL
jgi:hypothetical protein